MAVKKTVEFMIVNRRSGKALQATGLDNGLVVEQATAVGSDAQLWTSVKTDDSVKLFNKGCGKVLDVMQGGFSNGTWAQTWEDVDGETQKWKVVNVTSTYKKLVNAASGKALDIVDMSDEDGAPAQIWEDVEGIGQQWKFVSASPKTETKTVKKPVAKKSEKTPAKAKAAPKATAAKVEAAKTTAKKAVETAIKAEPQKAITKAAEKPKAVAAKAAAADKKPAGKTDEKKK